MSVSHTFERLVDSVATEVTSCSPDMSRMAHKGEKNLIKKGVRGSLLHLGRRYPEHMHRMYDAVALQKGYRRIAGGNQNIVITNGRHAIKVDRESLAMSPNERKVNAGDKEELYSLGLVYMSRFLIDQVVEISKTPLKDGREAVITKQPLVDIAVHDLIGTGAVDVSAALRARNIPARHVGAQLEVFCGQSKDIEKSEGLMPDVGGIGNLVVSSEGSLVLVDSYMTTSEHRDRPSIRPGHATIGDEHATILQQMQDLSANLLYDA